MTDPVHDYAGTWLDQTLPYLGQKEEHMKNAYMMFRSYGWTAVAAIKAARWFVVTRPTKNGLEQVLFYGPSVLDEPCVWAKEFGTY